MSEVTLDHHNADRFLSVIGPSGAYEPLKDQFDHNIWYEVRNKMFFVWTKQAFYAEKQGKDPLVFSDLSFARITWADATYIAAGLGTASELLKPIPQNPITRATLNHLTSCLPTFTKSADDVGGWIKVPKGLMFNTDMLAKIAAPYAHHLAWADELGTRVNFRFEWAQGTSFVSLPSRTTSKKDLDKVYLHKAAFEMLHEMDTKSLKEYLDQWGRS